jgi:uncharacterized membrane protein (DUF485 family)
MQSTPAEDFSMLLILAIILLIAWLCGFLVFHVTSGLIHIIVVVAVILFILHFVRGRRV